MNKVKRLFSPHALAATIASGMLLHSALNALADCYQLSAIAQQQNCGTGRACSAYQCGGGGSLYYWCCTQSESCWYCVTPIGGPYGTTKCCS